MGARGRKKGHESAHFHELPESYEESLRFPFAGTPGDFITRLLFCLSSRKVVLELNGKGRIIKKDGIDSKTYKVPKFIRASLSETLFPDMLRGEGGLSYTAFHRYGRAYGLELFSNLRAIYTKKSPVGFSIPQERLEYLIERGGFESPEEWLRVPRPEIKPVYEPLPVKIKIGPISTIK
jgi:hypothetical protein